MYKTGHAFSYLLVKESVANDVIKCVIVCRNGRTVNLITGDDFLICFAVNVNEQRIIAF